MSTVPFVESPIYAACPIRHNAFGTRPAAVINRSYVWHTALTIEPSTSAPRSLGRRDAATRNPSPLRGHTSVSTTSAARLRTASRALRVGARAGRVAVETCGTSAIASGMRGGARRNPTFRGEGAGGARCRGRTRVTGEPGRRAAARGRGRSSGQIAPGRGARKSAAAAHGRRRTDACRSRPVIRSQTGARPALFPTRNGSPDAAPTRFATRLGPCAVAWRGVMQ
jgi:hypothetical protein